jgi:HK97 family phage major capsid protein
MSKKKNNRDTIIRNSQKTLPKILLFATASRGEQKSMLGKEWFKKTLEGKTVRYPHNYKSFGAKSPYERVDTYKALLQTEAEAVAETTLVQEEVYRTIIEGAEPYKCWREVLPITAAETYRTRVVKGESGYYATEVAETGAPTIDTQEYSYVNIPITKYGIRPVITEELIADSLFDVVDLELSKAGSAMENKLNRVCLNEILNSSRAISTNTLNPEGTHLAVSDLALARSKVIKANWGGVDKLVTHPTAEGYLLQDSNIAYAAYMGTAGPLTTGTVPKLMGLTPYTCTATDLASSPVWDDTTAGSDVTGIILSNSAPLAMIRMRHDLKVKQYDDPIHDLVGMNLTMRYGVRVINETGGCKIFHK